MSDYAPRPARWAQPELVAEIEFSEWTRDGRVRHAGCLGLRYDKARGDVIRQEPAA
jgi:bifunctional non-homologous end joining protein LigD